MPLLMTKTTESNKNSHCGSSRCTGLLFRRTVTSGSALVRPRLECGVQFVAPGTRYGLSGESPAQGHQNGQWAEPQDIQEESG